jgi:iron complex transport system permease protein
MSTSGIALATDERNVRGRVVLLAGLLLFFLALSLFLGRYPGPYFTTPAALREDALARRLLMHLRMPRVLMAVLAGMVLSASGNVFQMAFRNPLVDSGFLGVTAGASFGASLAIVLLGGEAWTVQVCAALFGLMGLAGSYTLGQRIRFGDWALRLLLAGIAVSAIFTSGTGLLKYLSDPLKALPEITFWLLGGIWGATWMDLLHILPVVAVCLVILYLFRWRLNLLSMRDETAFSLGVAAGRERLLLLLAAVVSTTAIVSKTGLVMWVGMIVPHLARRWIGSDAQRSLAASMIIGGLFVLACDDVARTLLPGEIPLGVLSASIGAAIFIGLMIRRDWQVRR